MRKIADIAAYIFIVAVVILTIISIFGIWELISDDSIMKSFQSIGLLAIVTVVILIAERVIDRRNIEDDYKEEYNADIHTRKAPFKLIRHITLVVLILAVVLLAFFGILAIWEVLDGEVVVKSLASISVIAFSAFVIVLTSLNREDHKLIRSRNNLSLGGIILILIVVWIILSIIF